MKLLISISLIVFLTFSISAQVENDNKSNLDNIVERLKGNTEETKRVPDRSSKEDYPEEHNNENNSNFSYLQKLVNPSLVLIKQEYQIEKNGEYVGKSGEDYWGYKIGVGIQLENQILLSSDLIEPWKYDKSFPRRENPETNLLTIKLMSIKDKSYQEIDATIASTSSERLATIPTQNNAPLSVVSSEVNENLILFLFSVDKKESDSPVIYQNSHSINKRWSNNEIVLSDFNIPKNCIGGILFYENKSPGQLSLQVAGVARVVQDNIKINAVNGFSDNVIASSERSKKTSRERSKKGNVEKKKKEDKVSKGSSRQRGRSSGRQRGRSGN